ncbi:MAG: hypothetical protein FAZ92_00266 [Accumulibacter sp.]|nr:MAG: hypothetical protein FAZ92_00266 [Accumulibacter sp.]
MALAGGTGGPAQHVKVRLRAGGRVLAAGNGIRVNNAAPRSRPPGAGQRLRPRPGCPARRGRDTALIMTTRGCFHAHPRIRGCVGSGDGKRTGQTEPVVVVPVRRVVPVALGRACVLRSVVPRTAAQHAPDRRAVRLPRRVEPAAAKEGVAQAPRIGVPGVGDPRRHALLDLCLVHRARPPAVAQTAQPVAEAAQVLFGQVPAATRFEHVTEKGRCAAVGAMRILPGCNTSGRPSRWPAIACHHCAISAGSSAHSAKSST